MKCVVSYSNESMYNTYGKKSSETLGIVVISKIQQIKFRSRLIGLHQT